MDNQHQTKKENKSQPHAVVEVDWINFRSDKGRSDYGDHRCSLSVSEDEINYLRSLVSRCHSDTDPAPDEDQFYFFNITTRERKRWVMMRSQNNLDLMAQGERKGRVFNAILLSGECLQRILPNGNPLHLINLPTFDVVGELADELKSENHKDVDYRVQGRPLTFDSQYPIVPDRRSNYLTKQQKAYSPDSVQELFTKITLDCVGKVRPSSFATWWSSLRPLPDHNPFDYVFLSPQPKQLIERSEALSKALRLIETVHQIKLPDSIDNQSLHLWKAIISLSEKLYKDINNIFNAAAQDRTVWTNEWPEICTAPTLIAQRLMSLGERMLGTNYDLDYRFVYEAAENYQKLASELRSVRPPKLSTNAFTASESTPEPLISDTKLAVIRSIGRSPITRRSIIVCSLLLLVGGLYFGVKRFQSDRSEAPAWSDYKTVLKKAEQECDKEVQKYISKNNVLRGSKGKKADKKEKLTAQVKVLANDKADYYYRHDTNENTIKNRFSEIHLFFKPQVNSAISQGQRKEVEAERKRLIDSEITKLKSDLLKILMDKYISSFDKTYKPDNEQRTPSMPSQTTRTSSPPNGTNSPPARPTGIGQLPPAFNQN